MLRATTWLTLTLCLMCVLGRPIPADDAKADPKAVLERALAALGGEDKLTKFNAGTAQMKGTIHTGGLALPFTGEMAYQGAEQSRVLISGELCGLKFVYASVLNGTKGWNHEDGETKEMTAEELAEAREQAYATWVGTLVPLKDKAFALTALADTKVEERPAVGFKVSHKDRRDIFLFFDKESGLPAKSAMRVKDDDGQEVNEETFFRDYRDVQGVKQAYSFLVKRDGKMYFEAKLLDVKLLEKLDDRVFGKP